ncbi:MAG: putative DNA binding domain-containing protein, partial [Anaerolineae bacterium]|nr:putative DNA binding domain-containing protein [Anaerolineae bacterium]
MEPVPNRLDPPAEGSEYAYKPEATTPASLAETLVAFANAGGGTVLIGMDPRSGEPRGLQDPEAALDRALQAALSVDPPLIIPMPQVVEAGGQPLLMVSVPAGLSHVYSYRGKYLVRDGRQNRPLDPRQLRRLMMERGAVSFEDLIPDAARAEDIDWAKAEQYLASLAGLRALPREEALLRRGCYAQSSAGLRPTYAGLLL